MRTLIQSLDPRLFNLRTYLGEFEFSENFRFSPKHLRGDVIGGLTAAIVALPLALGFGLLAFNGDPRGAVAGLYGAIFTGILASLFGGTPHQITGPTGGMTVILTTVFIQYGGIDALLAACIIAGILQIAYGFLKLGKYVSLVPYPVTVGFTNGIAILIFIQQLKTFNTSLLIGLATMAAILVISKINKNLPKSLLGLIVGSLIGYFFASSDAVRTVFDPSGSQFTIASTLKVIGEIPSSFQFPSLPNIPWDTWKKVFPAGFTISMLGAIETLLASVVADNATESRHNSNKELVGQGIGNFVAPLFGGIAGTGAIVRTMVNIRAGGSTRLSGILHGLVLILVMLFLGPLASHIPLAALAGVLMMTAIGMLEIEPIKLIPKTPAADAAVLIATILITVFTDLITAVEVGMVMAAFLFVHRMSDMGMNQAVLQEIKGVSLDESTLKLLKDNKIVIFDVEGPLFFGAAKSFITALEKNFDVNVVILDMENVPIIDTTGAVTLETIVERLNRDRKRLLIVGLRDRVRKVLYDLGVTQKIGIGNFLPTVDESIQYALTLTKQDIEKTHLGGYISEPLIMLDVIAADKTDVLKKMVAQAKRAGVIKNRSQFLESIMERESVMPTIIGKGVAVPHAHLGGIDDRVTVMVARLKEPIPYSFDNTESVKVIFMVSAGKDEREYLNVLRLIATNINNTDIYHRLLNAADASEVHHLLSELRMNPPVKMHHEEA